MGRFRNYEFEAELRADKANLLKAYDNDPELKKDFLSKIDKEINTIEYLQAHPEVSQLRIVNTYRDEETWLNADGYDDIYFSGVYYPTKFLHQGGTSQEMKVHMQKMNFDYKKLNKIWKTIYNQPASFSKKLSIDDMIDMIIKRALDSANRGLHGVSSIVDKRTGECIGIVNRFR